jgi:hypothetical protein
VSLSACHSHAFVRQKKQYEPHLVPKFAIFIFLQEITPLLNEMPSTIKLTSNLTTDR